jgi:hypothetical protein
MNNAFATIQIGLNKFGMRVKEFGPSTKRLAMIENGEFNEHSRQAWKGRR